jgi:hypothetical protein
MDWQAIAWIAGVVIAANGATVSVATRYFSQRLNRIESKMMTKELCEERHERPGEHYHNSNDRMVVGRK